MTTTTRETTTAAALFDDLRRGHGHRCMAGQAPEGYLEIWPDNRPVILHISHAENRKLGDLIDAAAANQSTTK
jgi:hypothetical protein